MNNRKVFLLLYKEDDSRHWLESRSQTKRFKREKMRRTNVKNEEGGGRIKRGSLFREGGWKSERD
jgi:hypothetical protein